MDIPDVRYTRAGDVAIAYQVVGDGPRDLVLLPFLANIWSFWRLYGFAEFGHKLAKGRRLIVINPRGVGLSDRPRGFTIESRMDDIRVVMDAVASDRASVLGLAESAATCAVFAASYPERLDRLILYTPYLRGLAGDDDRTRATERIRYEQERWGDRDYLEEMARHLNPQWADNEEYLERFVEHHRLTASPATIVEFRRMQVELDISDVLPAIRVPTLVLDKRPMESRSAEVAAGIPGAEYSEIPGQGYAIWENDFALEAIEDFLAGTSPRRIPDSVLATVLFTDLVGSTGTPRRWVTGAGATSSHGITPPCGASSAGIAVSRSTRRGTAFSAASTGRRERSRVRVRSWTMRGSWSSRFARECTPGSAR